MKTESLEPNHLTELKIILNSVYNEVYAGETNNIVLPKVVSEQVQLYLINEGFDVQTYPKNRKNKTIISWT